MAIDYSRSNNGSPWKSIIKPLIYIFALSLCETFGGSLSARTLGEQPSSPMPAAVIVGRRRPTRRMNLAPAHPFASRRITSLSFPNASRVGD
jgi:hypothetical protein